MANEQEPSDHIVSSDSWLEREVPQFDLKREEPLLLLIGNSFWCISLGQAVSLLSFATRQVSPLR